MIYLELKFLIEKKKNINFFTNYKINFICKYIN